jgi:hypothetical protein
MARHQVNRPFAAFPADRRQRNMPVSVSPKLLVAAGALMFPLYIVMDVCASLAYAGYSYRDQTISELSAIGAPTRTFWLSMSVLYQVLAFAFAFAVGVLTLAGGRRTVRVVGWLLMGSALTGLLWWISPMHRREVLAAGGGTWQDTMHLVTAALTTVLYFAMIGVGAFAFGRRFRWYSFATIGLMIGFGMLMNREMPQGRRKRAHALAGHLGTDHCRRRHALAGRLRHCPPAGRALRLGPAPVTRRFLSGHGPMSPAAT